MDFLNKSIAQVSELFRSMTPGARVTAGLLLAVVLISLGYLFRQGTAGPDAYLFGGQPLGDSELTRIEAAIAQARLSGHTREGNRIRVPGGQQAEYMAAVADAGALPPNFNTILEKALDKTGPWESSAATRERLKIAKQQTLTEIIRAMPWVEEAMVLYDEQQPRGLSTNKQVTGSVSVRPVLGESLDPRRAKMLQKLVAHAVVGMKPSDVAVTNLGDGGSFGAGESYPEFDDEYQKTRVAVEMQKRESIMNALRDIPGVRVEVNAELNDTFEETIHNVKPDKEAIAAAREMEVTKGSTQTTTKAGGQPGPIASGPTRQGATESPLQNTNTTTDNTSETENMIGVSDSKTLKKGYTPKEVRASVTIPSSYIEVLWKQRNPTVTEPPKPEDLEIIQGQVITKVENIVEPLLLLEATKGQNTYKYVTVEVLPSLPAPTIEPPSTTSQAMAWTGRYWSTIAMLGVAMFSLLVLRSVVRGGRAGEVASLAAPTPSLTLQADDSRHRPEDTASSPEEPAEDRPRLRLRKGKTIKDDLVQIVHEDPDAAAEILRSWIGKVG